MQETIIGGQSPTAKYAKMCDKGEDELNYGVINVVLEYERYMTVIGWK